MSRQRRRGRSEDISCIFDEFYRAKDAKAMERQETGLGLSIIKRMR